MSEQTPEGDAWDTPDDGWADDGDAAEAVEPEGDDSATGSDTGSGDEIIDAEVVEPGQDDQDPGWGQFGSGTADDPIVTTARSAPSDKNAVEPYRVTDDPNAWGWGQPAPQEPAKPVPSEHGQRPGGGSQGGMKGDGAGSGAGTGKRKPTRRERKRGMKGAGGSGGGGDNVLIKIERRSTKTVNASLIDVRGSGSGNKAGVLEAPRRRGGASARIAGRRKP